jgi:membrane-associated protein
VVNGPAIEKALQLVEAHGYLLLFAASAAENVFLVGLVVPGDVIVVLGGAMAARAHLTAPGVLGWVVAGVVLGANASYWIGRAGGMTLVDRLVGRPKVKRAEEYFRLHGAKTVLLAAFVAGIKNIVPAVAGASRMPAWRFALYNAGGSIVRSAVLVCIGYLLGAHAGRAVRAAGAFNAAAIGAAIVLAVAFAILRRRARH